MAQNIVEIIIKAIDQTKSGLTTPVTNLETLKTSLGKLNTFFGIGSAAAAFFFEQLIAHSIESAAALEKMHQQTGISVESLSTLKFAAEQSDTNIESLGVGLKKMSTLMLQASQGNATAKAAFDQLGISVKNSDGTLRNQNDVLIDVATKFHGLEDGAMKSALAVKIFGRSGTELIPFLNQGGEAIKGLQDKAVSLGLQISGNTAEQAHEFQNAIKEIEAGVGGLGNRIITTILPALVKLTEEFASLFEKGNGIAMMFDGIGAYIKLAWDWIMKMVAALEILFKVMADVTAGAVLFFAAFASGNFRNVQNALKAIGDQLKNDVITSLTNTGQIADETGKKMDDMGKKGTLAAQNLAKIKITAADIKKAFDELHPGTAAFFKEFQSLGTKSFSSVKDAVLDLSAVTMQTFDKSATTAITDLVKGGKTAQQAFVQLGDAMLTSVLNWLVQMGLAKAEQAAMAALGNSLLGQSTAASAAAAAGVGVAWSGPAAAVSLATFGANAGPANAAILSTSAMSKGAFASFAVGSDYIQQTGMALIHQGERVVPSKTNQDLTSALKGSGGGVTHVHLNVDGREIANVVLNQQRLGFLPK